MKYRSLCAMPLKDAAWIEPVLARSKAIPMGLHEPQGGWRARAKRRSIIGEIKRVRSNAKGARAGKGNLTRFRHKSDAMASQLLKPAEGQSLRGWRGGTGRCSSGERLPAKNCKPHKDSKQLCLAGQAASYTRHIIFAFMAMALSGSEPLAAGQEEGKA